ncbi:MAG: hypothetical protein R3225_08025 [Halofilum sp. (in: g-proteobacteria)]|nr:hypothetical protein [Halofilum sp. (in: g-proteobacteria)]
METVAAALEGLALAEWLRQSRWGYAAVNAGHVFGIALLVGAIVPVNLRLLGLWRSLALRPLYAMLARIAATGLALAIVTGLLLFSVRATEYVALELFLVKLVLVAVGALHASTLHWATRFPDVSRARQRLAGTVSLLLWPIVLVCGRLLAFL